MPALSAEDIVVQAHDGSMPAFGQVTKFEQDPGFSLRGGSGIVTFKTPAVPASTLELMFSMSTVFCNIQKSGSFSFEYLPAITGPAIADPNFFPKQLYRDRDLEVVVTMMNVARLSQPFNASKFRVRIGSVQGAYVGWRAERAVDGIVSSDRTKTSVKIRASGPWEGSALQMQIWSVNRGRDNAAQFVFQIVEPPDPTILGLFPARGKASEYNRVSVTIGHISLMSSLSDFSGDKAKMLLASQRACTTSSVGISMSAQDMISGLSIDGVTYSVYWGYPVDYYGCVSDSCGSLITEVTGSAQAEVDANADYLLVATLSGFYSAYQTISVGDESPSNTISFQMLETMQTDQDRVVLSWDFMDDLDLWVYDKEDRSNSVGYSGKTDSFAGGTITLDVDVQEGPGVETTQFMSLASGSVEVWVDHYGGQFTQDLVSDTPATVDIFCYRCADDENTVKVGFVREVQQNSADVPSDGMKWWKVGEFTAPACTDDPDWMETNSETVDNDQGGQTTTTWNTKCAVGGLQSGQPGPTVSYPDVRIRSGGDCEGEVSFGMWSM